MKEDAQNEKKELTAVEKQRGVRGRIYLSKLIHKLAEKIAPNYWECMMCGHISNAEGEIYCWKCGVGEMIYKTH